MLRVEEAGGAPASPSGPHASPGGDDVSSKVREVRHEGALSGTASRTSAATRCPIRRSRTRATRSSGSRACAICGSDLHLYDGFMPGMKSGDIMGHETMGEVVEVGREQHGKLKVGDRVVVPFTIICGECDQCQRGNFSVCERTQPQQGRGRQGVRPHHGGALRLHAPHRRLCRAARPSTCACPSPTRPTSRCPDGIPDEKVLFLGDIFPTGWQAAVQCDIQPTDTVAIWGCGPGRPDGDPQRRPARREAGDRHRPRARAPRHGEGRRRDHDQLRRGERDRAPERADRRQGARRSASTRSAWRRMPTATLDSMYDRAKQAVMLETDRPHVLREMIYVCRPAGMLSVPGVYGGLVDKIPVRRGDEQGPDHPHRPDAREPLDRRSPAPHRGGPDRPVLRHHPHGRRSKTGPRCTRPSATSRTAASRWCSSREGERRHALRKRRIAPARPPAIRPPTRWPAGSAVLASRSASPSSAPRAPCAGALGMQGSESADPRPTACARSQPASASSASNDPTPWIWGRVAGDALDHRHAGDRAAKANNPKQGNLAVAFAAVAGVTALDVYCAQATQPRGRPPLAVAAGLRRPNRLPPPAKRHARRGARFRVPRDFRIPEPLRPYGT